jgi:hypothetical protein
MPKHRRAATERSHENGSNLVTRRPADQNDPIAPYEQLNRLLFGLSQQRGGRRVAARVAAVVMLAAIVAVVAAALIHAFI